MLSFQLFACFDLTSFTEIFEANWQSAGSIGLGQGIRLRHVFNDSKQAGSILFDF